MTRPTLTTATALRCASAPGGVTSTRLAAEAGLSLPGARRLLARLLAAGYLVEIDREPTGRRKRVVYGAVVGSR